MMSGLGATPVVESGCLSSADDLYSSSDTKCYFSFKTSSLISFASLGIDSDGIPAIRFFISFLSDSILICYLSGGIFDADNVFSAYKVSGSTVGSTL